MNDRGDAGALSLAISVGACACTWAESWLESSGTVNPRMLAESILGPPYFSYAFTKSCGSTPRLPVG